VRQTCRSGQPASIRSWRSIGAAHMSRQSITLTKTHQRPRRRRRNRCARVGPAGGSCSFAVPKLEDQPRRSGRIVRLSPFRDRGLHFNASLSLTANREGGGCRRPHQSGQHPRPRQGRPLRPRRAKAGSLCASRELPARCRSNLSNLAASGPGRRSSRPRSMRAAARARRVPRLQDLGQVEPTADMSRA